MLRVLVITVAIAIVVCGIIKLIKLFSKPEKKEELLGDKTLKDLDKKAKKVAAEKASILEETQKNKDIIDSINNNLN